jgi:hypothetical protein
VGGDWGLFHELGHNAQWEDWVVPATTESTVNIFSAHAMETLVGKNRSSGYGHPALLPLQRAATVRAFNASGRRFFDGDAWTTLEMHLQLRELFGWVFFTELFTEYRGLEGAERPVGGEERVQQWVWRSSRAAGRDLRGFYEAWGWPLTNATSAKVAAMKLPAWTDHPMLNIPTCQLENCSAAGTPAPPAAPAAPTPPAAASYAAGLQPMMLLLLLPLLLLPPLSVAVGAGSS